MKKSITFFFCSILAMAGCKKDTVSIIQYYAYCQNCEVEYLVGGETRHSTVSPFEFVANEGQALFIQATSNSGSWVEVDILRGGQNYAYAKGFGMAKVDKQLKN